MWLCGFRLRYFGAMNGKRFHCPCHNRSSYLQVFYMIAELKKFAKSTGKRMRGCLFLVNLLKKTSSRLFFFLTYEIFQNNYFAGLLRVSALIISNQDRFNKPN